MKTINLHNKNKEVVGVVKVDDDDFGLVSRYNWSMTKAGYAYSPKCRRETGYWYMHRLIASAEDGLVVNHINHDKLDNRKENLEQVSHQVNIRKMKKQGGIYWSKERNKWCAQITIDGKTIPLGRYKTYDEALEKRLEAEEREWS